MNVQRAQANWNNWRAQLWDSFARLESTSDSPAFFGSVSHPVAGSTRLSGVRSTRQLTERTARNIRTDPADKVLLILQQSAHGFLEQEDRQARLQRGEFAICDTSRPYRLFFENPFEQIVLQLDRRRLAECIPSLRRHTARRLDGNSGPGLIVSGFVRQLFRDGAGLKDADLATFEGTFVQMLATVIRLSSDGDDDGAHARLNRLKARLLQEIRDPDFDLAEIARAEGMSLRTVQRLFFTDGTTPSAWVAAQRLAGVSRDLRSPGEASRSITDIAFSWGFRDLSHFSRAFKAQFGCNARQWRVGA